MSAKGQAIVSQVLTLQEVRVLPDVQLISWCSGLRS